MEEGITIVTITSGEKYENKKPAESYIKTIVHGLKEIKLDEDQILRYLMQKDGIIDNYEEIEIKEIIEIASISYIQVL